MKQSSKSTSRKLRALIGIVLSMALLSAMIFTGCGQGNTANNEGDAGRIDDTTTETTTTTTTTTTDSADWPHDGYLTGLWECAVETGDAQGLVYTLEFFGERNVIYTAGWKDSEIAARYTGTFELLSDNTTMQFDLTPDKEFPDAKSINGTFVFSIKKDTLTMTLQSGDGLAYQFGEGTPMVFTRP